ncbi:GNAT family N-acetyltransferase [Melghirimyces algeriensis]|uniref:N-acetylglutamate synthase, GNAT family n=1 Tax=Melghirimyces algeriensis TaxID=910412 RepID=A0A521D946_9BACL|nr:hypothetical protein [Melghirimyces algeriensis]SMO67400.1 N-acetylglutamate synthase, GNAT family [Melghirimyces algeriensis]
MYSVRQANTKDRETIVRLLRQASVSDWGVECHPENFLMVDDCRSHQSVGTVGLEVYGTKGVLRSFVLEKRFRNAKSILELIGVILSHVQRSSLQEIYLITGINPDIFQVFGFEPLDWESLPEEIRSSAQNRNVGPQEGIPMIYRCGNNSSTKIEWDSKKV